MNDYVIKEIDFPRVDFTNKNTAVRVPARPGARPVSPCRFGVKQLHFMAY